MDAQRTTMVQAGRTPVNGCDRAYAFMCAHSLASPCAIPLARWQAHAHTDSKRTGSSASIHMLTYACMRVVWHGQTDGKSRMLAGVKCVCFKVCCAYLWAGRLTVGSLHNMLSASKVSKASRHLHA